MEQFIFKQIDPMGAAALEAVAVADKFNAWMFEAIRPYCNGKILEIGSGIGNLSQFFIAAGYDITLSDIRENYCDTLSEKFEKSTACRAIRVFDLSDEDFENHYPDLIGQFDTVVSLNVVEHIFNDSTALANCAKLLRREGQAVILVPAYQWMYNRFDKEIEHHRRYSKRSLKKLMTPHFTIIHSQYFNVVGMLGWLVSAHILRNKTIPQGQMALYNKLMPIIKTTDKLFLNRLGLSVISVGRLNK